MAAAQLFETELPRWLIRHVCHPENHRLKQLPKSWHTSVQSLTNYMPITRVDSRLPSHYRPGDTSAKSVFVPQECHLDITDYRFWSECRDRLQNSTSMLITVRCRFCEKRYTLRDFKQFGRLEHKLECNATLNLRMLYDYVLERGWCIQCDLRTPNTKWGVCLCGPKCVDQWCHAEFHSSVMRRSLSVCQHKFLAKPKEPTIVSAFD